MLHSIHLCQKQLQYPFVDSFSLHLHFHSVACNEQMYKGKCSLCRDQQCYFTQVIIHHIVDL